jgi:hypothetical protein
MSACKTQVVIAAFMAFWPDDGEYFLIKQQKLILYITIFSSARKGNI